MLSFRLFGGYIGFDAFGFTGSITARAARRQNSQPLVHTPNAALPGKCPSFRHWFDENPESVYLLSRYMKGVITMRTRVQKWGNSLALRIPKPFATEIGLQRNSPVEMSLVDGRLVIAPVVEPAFTLEGLLAQVSEDNLHGEIETGPAVGKEAW
jgi:antitoxin MazE